MGRSFESVRLGVKNTADRWMRVQKAMRKEDQAYAEKLAEMAKRHSSEGFYAFDDPLEAAVFSVLVEMLKEIDGAREGRPAGSVWDRRRVEESGASCTLPHFLG
ncbi:MAG: hypothetical protein QCH35_01370 [Methanomicrobiaceae archaeon]|nr:hypothetical protein [Methanomicrobiaceae archaeon]